MSNVRLNAVKFLLVLSHFGLTIGPSAFAESVDVQIAGQLNSLKNAGQAGTCAYEEKTFTCSYASNSNESQLGKLLHDHRYTDSLVLRAGKCQADLRDSFTTPAELESYFASEPDFSVGAPALLISRCNTSELLPGPKRDEELKASVAEYYSDAARLNSAVKETLQGLAVIDSLQSKSLLSAVDCSIPELKNAKSFCENLRNTCTPQGGNFEVAIKAKQNLIEKKKLLEQVHWYTQNPQGPLRIVGTSRTGPIREHDLSDDQKLIVDLANMKIQALENDTPAIRDDSVAMNEINQAAKQTFDKNPNNPENLAKVSDSIFSKAQYDQDSATRSLLLERLKKLQSAAKCLGGKGDCSNFDEVMESDDSTEIPYTSIDVKADSRTKKGKMAYNAGLCQSQARRKARQHGKIGTTVTEAVGLTAASLFMPAFAVGALDAFYLLDSGLDAYKGCQPQLDQFHTLIQNEAKDPSAFCPKKSDPPKTLALKNISDCRLGIVKALPAVLPAVGIAVKAASRASEEASAIAKAERELNATTPRRTKGQFGRDYLSKDTDPEAFAQNSYKIMRSGAPEIEAPAEAINRALNETDEAQLKKLQDVAIQRQITRYKDAQKRLALLKASADPKDQARAAKLEAILKKDPVALGNGPHIQEILDNLDKNKNSIRTIFESTLGRKMTDAEFQHAYQYMRTVVAVHDLGKTFPAEVVLEVTKSFDKLAFLKGRISLHEVSSSAEIQWLVKKNNLDPKMADFLVRDILGHNDGSGLPDVFWNAIAQKGLGDYVKPDSPFASLMAFVDRGGQGTLGETGGVMKITNQQIGAGKAWGRELLENETMLKNAQNTNRQMEVIVDDFGKNYGTKIDGTPMVQALENENQRTIDCFHSIKWNPDNTSGVIAGQKFTNKDEFFKIVNGTENDIKAGKLPQDYWAKQLGDAPRAPAQTKDFTQLPAYGLSDSDRVNKAEQELQKAGLLKGRLTTGQKELLKNHLNEPGAIEPAYGTHQKPELKSKFKQAKAAKDADPNEGYTKEQVDYLIRGGYAGQSGTADAHAAIDAQAALRTKQAYMERNRFPGNPNSANDVMMSVDSASASALDRTIGNNDKFAKIRDELLGDTSAYKKPVLFDFFKPKPPELTDYAKAARDYAGAVQSNNLVEAAKQKIIMNRLIVEKLKNDPTISPPALNNLINTLQQMGTY